MKAPNILRHILTQPFESLRDLFTALIEPTAMTPHQRHLDEFKLLAGGAITGVGAVELNPVTAAGGVIPVLEATGDLCHAGHAWRIRHHRHG
jgi:hypothetical protein